MTSAICPLCGNGNHRFRFSERQYSILSCTRCKLWFISPYPSSDEAHLRTSTDNFGDLKIIDTENKYSSEVRSYVEFSPSILEHCDSAKTFLDVGCGCGHLLERLSSHSTIVERVGLELNLSRAQVAREKAGCPIYQIPVEQFNSKIRFDVITLINVFSHITPLSGCFENLRNLLSPNGRLILVTGEISGQAKKSAFWDWQVPDHVHFLGLETLDYLCQSYRFSILQRDRTPVVDEMLSRLDLKGRSRLRNAAKLLIRKTPFLSTMLKTTYKVIHGDSVYSSFIVLEAQD